MRDNLNSKKSIGLPLLISFISDLAVRVRCVRMNKIKRQKKDNGEAPIISLIIKFGVENLVS